MYYGAVAAPTPSPVVRIVLLHGIGTDVHIGSKVYWSYTGAAPSAANCVTLANSIGVAWGAQLKQMMSTNGLLEGVTVTDLASNAGNTGAAPFATAGTRVGSEITQAVATVLNFHIARRYRGGKPKVFLPYGVVADSTTGSNWLAAYVTAMNAAWAAFQTAVNGLVAGTTTLGVQQNVSYFSGSTANTSISKWARRNVPAPRAVPVVEPITSAVTQPILGSQRRRYRP